MERIIRFSILALLVFPALVHAQARPSAPKAEVKATVGWYGYDEDLHTAIGGAFAYYPAARANVELEGLYVLPRKSESIDNFRSFALTPSVGVDFRQAPVHFQPYGRIAYSIDHSRYTFRARTTPKAEPARNESHTNGSLGVRFGFKFYVGDRFFIYPEIGMGEKLLIKATLSAGYVTSHW